jgi:hypothetical protein
MTASNRTAINRNCIAVGWRRLLPAAAVAGALALGLPAVAHADTADDNFLKALAAQGITGDRDQLIAAGHAACDNYGSPTVAAQMAGLMAQGLSNVQASNVFLDGLKAYCPEKIAGMPLG